MKRILVNASGLKREHCYSLLNLVYNASVADQSSVHRVSDLSGTFVAFNAYVWLFCDGISTTIGGPRIAS